MSFEKHVIARKEWVCAFCERVIPIGKKHIFGKGRGARIDDDCETQIGIEYFEYRLCLDDPECKEKEEN